MKKEAMLVIVLSSFAYILNKLCSQLPTSVRKPLALFSLSMTKVIAGSVGMCAGLSSDFSGGAGMVMGMGARLSVSRASSAC